MRRFRYEYGAGGLHLLAVLASFALAGYGLMRIMAGSEPLAVLLWLFGAIIAHDLILFPLYSVAGLIAYRLERRPPIVARNHVRVPIVLSMFMFVVWFPLILGLSDERFERATGLTSGVYLERWLLLSAALFALSAVLYAFRIPLWRRDRVAQRRTS